MVVKASIQIDLGHKVEPLWVNHAAFRYHRNLCELRGHCFSRFVSGVNGALVVGLVGTVVLKQSGLNFGASRSPVSI